MFYKATKLIVITENFMREDICAIIDACGGSGYTLVPAGGKGLHHVHDTPDKATVVPDFSNVKIEVVCADRAKAEHMAEQILSQCFKNYSGIMYLEDVEILRPEHF